MIDCKGSRVTVDIGAQFFNPDTHPIYVTLLEELGLYRPARPDTGETLEAPSSLYIFPAAGAPPIFSSSHPLSTLQRALEFAKSAGAFRALVEHDVDHGLRYLVADPDSGFRAVYPGREITASSLHACLMESA